MWLQHHQSMQLPSFWNVSALTADQRIFATPSLRAKTDDPTIYYFSQDRINILVGAIVAMVLTALLVVPVAALYHFADVVKDASSLHAIEGLSGFTFLFSMAMSLVTQARRKDIFIASAIYLGVLVVSWKFFKD